MVNLIILLPTSLKHIIVLFEVQFVNLSINSKLRAMQLRGAFHDCCHGGGGGCRSALRKGEGIGGPGRKGTTFCFCFSFFL